MVRCSTSHSYIGQESQCEEEQVWDEGKRSDNVLIWPHPAFSSEPLQGGIQRSVGTVFGTGAGGWGWVPTWGCYYRRW